MKLLIVLTVISAFAPGRSIAQIQSTCQFPKLQEKCKPYQCINQVRDTSVRWGEVTSSSFIARWQPEFGARCYYIELLDSYTINTLQIIPCHKGTSYTFKKLQPSRIYGIQVSVVDYSCMRGNPGVPARTRTRRGSGVWKTRKGPPKPTPKPGRCGKGFFTCDSNPKECVPNGKWCNRRLDCEDGSDERKCPGGCKEINPEFKNGNFSCSFWGSPGSVCIFDCDDIYERDGLEYAICERKTRKWSNPIPSCKLPKPASIRIVNEETTSTSFQIEWENVIGAKWYTVRVEKPTEDKKSVELVKTKMASECCGVVVDGLIPDVEYSIRVNAVDDDEENGKMSNPVFGRTAERDSDETSDITE